MSQRDCSLAVDETKIEAQEERNYHLPTLNLLVKSETLKTRSLNHSEPTTKILAISGKVTVSF